MRLTRLMRPILSVPTPRLPRAPVQHHLCSQVKSLSVTLTPPGGSAASHVTISGVSRLVRPIPRGRHRSGTCRPQGMGWWRAEGAGTLGSVSQGPACGEEPHRPPRCATISLHHPMEAGWDIPSSGCGVTGVVGITRPSSAAHSAKFQVGSASPPMSHCHPLVFRHDQVNDEGKGKYYIIIVTVIIIIHYFKHVK